jgi:hypothetical protein
MAHFSYNKETYPIVMFDCSGSTEHSINIGNHYQNTDTVLKYEIAIAQRTFNKKGITHVYVIMWNYTGRICSEKPILVSELGRIRLDSIGGTCLSEGLKIIPENWINGEKKNDIYIFTDGEIEDDNIVINPLKKLIDLGIKIQIITVEPNNINYLQTKGEAGHKLFQIIKSNRLTKSVRRFSSYNEYHINEPFISFDNPEYIEGFTSFGGEYFNIEEQKDELLDKVEESIHKCENKDDVVKLAHELSLTIHHMVKDKTTEEQIEINNEFSDMFADSNIDPMIFSQVNKMLLIESGNHLNGSASSFHEFKDALILYN